MYEPEMLSIPAGEPVIMVGREQRHLVEEEGFLAKDDPGNYKPTCPYEFELD